MNSIHPMPFPATDLPLTATAVLPSAARKARFWDRIAPQYAAGAIADMPGYEATLRRVQALLLASGQAQDVLELGCGTGSTALRLAPLTRRMLATDVSAGMIAIARERLAAQPMAQLSLAVADADAGTWGQACYDTVLAFNLLHLVRDLDQTLLLAARALRPGGLLVSKTPCIAEMNPLIPHLAIPLARALGKAPEVRCLGERGLTAAIARQGLHVEAVERHGTRGKDIRVFIVARKPG